MADEATAKTVSARGAFFIGLVLGVGVVLLYSILKTGQLQEDLLKVKSELALTQKKMVEAHGEIAVLRDQISTPKPVSVKPAE